MDFTAQLRAAAALKPQPSTTTALTATALGYKVEKVVGVYEARKAAEDDVRVAVEDLTQEVQLLTLTEVALTTLLTDVSAASLRAIEQTVTYGLQTVFDDRPLTFKLQVTQIRGGQSVVPVLTYGGVEAPILDAFGGGPSQVAAFLLRLIVCHRLGLYPLLLLDESFSMVSVEYLANLAKLLTELAERLGYTFLLVTQTRHGGLVEGATCAYRVQETAQGTTFVRETTT